MTLSISIQQCFAVELHKAKTKDASTQRELNNFHSFIVYNKHHYYCFISSEQDMCHKNKSIMPLCDIYTYRIAVHWMCVAYNVQYL